jgi:hypothetical protein
MKSKNHNILFEVPTSNQKYKNLLENDFKTFRLQLTFPMNNKFYYYY